MRIDEEYSAAPKQKKGISTRAFLPAIGFLLMIAFGVIAYTLGPILNKQFGGQLGLASLGPQLNMTGEQIGNLFFSVVVFLVLVLLGGLIMSAFAPKRRIVVHERDMDRERKLIMAEAKMKKKRKEQAKVAMAKERKAAAQAEQNRKK